MYSARYYLSFHVTAIDLGTYYLRIRGTTVYATGKISRVLARNTYLHCYIGTGTVGIRV
jgi:hypothetical protein